MDPSSDIRVGRLRISTMATRIRDKVAEIGGPDAFATRLVTLQPVRGLAVTLPFETPPPGQPPPVEWTFWSRATEQRSLAAPTTVEKAGHLSRATLPLRHRGSLAAPAALPRMEVFLHPFGWTALVTVDLTWSEPEPLAEVLAAVDDLSGRPATVDIGGASVQTTVDGAAAAGADAVTGILGVDGGQEWAPPDHRVVTVIDAAFDPVPTAMPARESFVHSAVHQLSRGGAALAEPDRAFVPRWSGQGFGWAARDLVYLLDQGTSALMPAAAAARPATYGQQTSARHRYLALLLSHIAASVGLVQAGQATASQRLQEWARLAADRLARMYGPASPASDYWGLETRRYLTSIGVTDAIVALRGGKALEAKSPDPATYP